jgi:hypothetical protein
MQTPGIQHVVGIITDLKNKFCAPKILLNSFQNGRMGTLHFTALAVYYRGSNLMPNTDIFCKAFPRIGMNANLQKEDCIGAKVSFNKNGQNSNRVWQKIPEKNQPNNGRS